MELKKLMEHISIIPDYRQAWKVEHKLSDILLSVSYTHLDVYKRQSLESGT